MYMLTMVVIAALLATGIIFPWLRRAPSLSADYRRVARLRLPVSGMRGRRY